MGHGTRDDSTKMRRYTERFFDNCPQVAWADGENELRLAVGLVGLYGLRPAELAMLTVKDGKGRVGHVKRNTSSIGARPSHPGW